MTLQNVSAGRIYGKAICSSDGLFHLYWEITADTLYFAVCFVGSKRTKLQIRYNFQVCFKVKNV
jgi:hypothetical protein